MARWLADRFKLTTEDARAFEQQFRADGFTLDDFLAQLQQVKKLGSVSDLLGMIPGGAKLAERMASVPVNQLMMQKLMVNQALENMGLRSTQMFATIFDGITRHSPEGIAFKRRAENDAGKRNSPATKHADRLDKILAALDLTLACPVSSN